MFIQRRLLLTVIACLLAPLVISSMTQAKQASQAQEQANRAEQQRQAVYSASQSIPTPEMVGRQPEKDLDTLDLVEPLRQQMAELEKEFAEGMKSGNQPYRNLASTIEYVRQRIDAFVESLKKFASLEMIEADAQHARKMIGMAIENQAPAYFQPSSDIAIRRKSIDVRIASLEKINPKSDQLKSAKQIAEQLKSQALEAQKKLLDQLLKQNQPPVDGYQKADRAELLDMVKSTWEKAAPGVKPLKIGLVGNDWQRSKKWEIQNRTLYEIDRSRIQGFVIVAHDDRTVVCRRIQLNRDHVNQEQTTAWLLNDPKSEPEVFELLLKSKVP